MDLRARLQAAAARWGAVAFGIASVDEADALPPVKIGHTVNRYSKTIRSTMPEARSVIIIGAPSIDDADELAVERRPGIWSYPGYFRLNLAERDLIKLLRGEGYRANCLSELASYKRLAILAGIGAYGKSSLVISPRHGPWLRLGAVATDAELPLDEPFTRDLCEKCRRCVDACPAKALTPYVVDSNRCLVGASIRTVVPESLKPLLPANEPQLTPKTHIMCTKCQQACRYTTADRRRSAYSGLKASPRRRHGRNR